MEKIISFSLPDGKFTTLNSIYFDGLKPVQRRVLYGMYEQGAFNKKNYRKRKSARIVGDVPHGDSSVYEAIVRMAPAPSWSLRSTLIDGIIKFLVFLVYTENILKLNFKKSLKLFDLKKDTVDIKLNKEPIVNATNWKNNNEYESTSAEKVIGMICINDFKKEYILVVYDLSPYSKRIKINKYL
ncbi:MAG: DNA gyrase subunit A [Candidatus Karelsulcia muelleri]